MPKQVKAVVRVENAKKSPATSGPPSATTVAIAPPQFQQTKECAECMQQGVATRVADGLKGEFPELRGMIVDLSIAETDKMYATLVRLMEAAKAAGPERRPTLLLAADLVAKFLRLPNPYPATPELQRQLDALAGIGIKYSWYELGGEYLYHRDLLWQVWREYSATSSGEDAFVLLLDSGWDTTDCCSKGNDAFHNVIREAEQFLANHPQSARRLDVQWAAAQAYETWWSLSLTPAGRENDEDSPKPEPYREGAEKARASAIAYYEDIVKNAAESTEAKCSLRSLEMLKQGQDTHQRRFFCYCD